jgi:hypothetical protein
VTARAHVADWNGEILQGLATVYNEAKKPVVEFSSTFKIAKDTVIREKTECENL